MEKSQNYIKLKSNVIEFVLFKEKTVTKIKVIKLFKIYITYAFDIMQEGEYYQMKFSLLKTN